jgi:hypothetical protein
MHLCCDVIENHLISHSSILNITLPPDADKSPDLIVRWCLYLMEWKDGMERWNGMMEWNDGIVERPRPHGIAYGGNTVIILAMAE